MTPATTLEAELEAAFLGEIEDWLPAYAAAHPDVDLTQTLRELARVLIATLLATAKAQANAGRTEPHSPETLMRRLVQPILLRAIYETSLAVTGREAP